MIRFVYALSLLLVACTDTATPPPTVTGHVTQARPECVGTTARVEAYQRIAAGRIAFSVWDGRKALSAIALLNSIPPETATVGDWAAVGLLPEAPRAVAIIGRGGCVVEEMFILREHGEQIVKRLDGVPA
jgi:hypothetical protein